jgi:antitoxin HicB
MPPTLSQTESMNQGPDQGVHETGGTPAGGIIRTMNRQHEFDVVFEPQDEGGYTAYVPDLPGCVSEGDTLEEATAMIQEAMALYFDARRERGWALPKIEHRKLVPAA